jgi:hypothetical protein
MGWRSAVRKEADMQEIEMTMARNLMENTISQAIRDFEEKTKMQVSSIDLHRLSVVGVNPAYLWAIDTVVILPR